MKRTTKTFLLFAAAGVAAYWLFKKSKGMAGVDALSPDSFKDETADCQSRGGTLSWPTCPPGMVCDSMPSGCDYPGGRVKYSHFRAKEPSCGEGWWQSHICGASFPGRCVDPSTNNPMEVFTPEEMKMTPEQSCASLKARSGITDCGPDMVWDANARMCRVNCEQSVGQAWDPSLQACRNEFVVTPVAPIPPVPATKPRTLRESLERRVLYKPEKVALATIRRYMVPVRVVSRDGRAFLVTKDLNRNRANLTITRGIVTKVTWG